MGAVPEVERMVKEWTELRHTINELSKDHPKGICWICGIRPRQIVIPGIPVGMCRVCDSLDEVAA
ncbi:hypothetical protein [Rhodococcus sp. 3-2]|uniref:hypothetical protein n=1 Tax=Rhodococcus sp. 3-2 TaxID=2890836 RepID=UPI001D18B36D|nr:hypothetical protein [Rhodococcus sp. 3-2]MCC4300407.1 hypothetical protein [Rhodococcus sp. 3-2]MCC4300467.1 hypothetical protein [Rhodococcus sp. 3-2]